MKRKGEFWVDKFPLEFHNGSGSNVRGVGGFFSEREKPELRKSHFLPPFILSYSFTAWCNLIVVFLEFCPTVYTLLFFHSMAQSNGWVLRILRSGLCTRWWGCVLIGWTIYWYRYICAKGEGPCIYLVDFTMFLLPGIWLVLLHIHIVDGTTRRTISRNNE